MKICYLANPNIAHTLRWSGFFASLSYEVHLIGEHKPARKPAPGVVFHDLTAYTNLRKVRYALWPWIIRRIIREIQPDILHSIGIASAGWLGAAASFHPFIATSLGSDLLLLHRRSRLHRQLSLWVLNKADTVVCVSKQLTRQAIALGVESDKLETIYPGIDTGIFAPLDDRKAVRRKLGLGPEPVVLSIRAMNWIYNALDIAQAIPLVLDKAPQARFLIFTYNQDPALFSQFKAQITESGCEQAVTYIPELANDRTIAQYYQAADIAVSVPSSDGTPSSVLESMACKTALVLSDLPTLHDWARDEREALFVPKGDVQAIAAAILRLIKDKKLRQELAQNAAQKVRQEAGVETWMGKMDQIYRRFA
ncbi:MAG: glycosyltransferase family 4 protein [Anaerolineales bacterium]